MEDTPATGQDQDISKAVNEISQFVDAVQSSVTRPEADDEIRIAFLRKINEIMARFPTELLAVTPGQRSSVLYALNPETTQWAAAHVPDADRPLWQAINISPETAGKWIEAGLGVETAARWKSARPYYFSAENMDPVEVAEWEKTPIAPDVAFRWMDNNISPERALRWLHAGGTVVDGLNWLKEFPDESPEDVYVVSQGTLSVPNVQNYVQRGVPLLDVPAFAVKGYTPFAAAKLVKNGITASAAENKTGDAPIPGKAWQKIKTAADAKGWTVVSISEVPAPRRRSMKETRVVFAKPTSPHGDIEAYFEANRFRCGVRKTRSYWRDTTNTITQFVADYLV